MLCKLLDLMTIIIENNTNSEKDYLLFPGILENKKHFSIKKTNA